MKRLPGHRVLIVEDNGLIALELERLLRDRGVKVVGPVSSVEGALSLVADGALGAAVLDLNLGGEDVSRVADVLAEAGTPFMFLTGHSKERVPARHRGRPLLLKPYAPARLLSMLASLLPPDRKFA
jgi:DNA-binding response OmpR family regulator